MYSVAHNLPIAVFSVFVQLLPQSSYPATVVSCANVAFNIPSTRWTTQMQQPEAAPKTYFVRLVDPRSLPRLRASHTQMYCHLVDKTLLLARCNTGRDERTTLGQCFSTPPLEVAYSISTLNNFSWLKFSIDTGALWLPTFNYTVCQNWRRPWLQKRLTCKNSTAAPTT